mgnify:CR=1 FL=1
MTKEEYKKRICPSCVNYEYKRNGELCMKWKEDKCTNYRRIFACGEKLCNFCRKCDKI